MFLVSGFRFQVSGFAPKLETANEKPETTTLISYVL
jgi:hypothetical protein